MRTLSRAVVAAICAAVLVVGSSPAHAGNVKKARTTIEASFDLLTDNVEGTVGSAKPKCVRQRKVVAFDSFGDKIGKDQTDNDGAFVIDASEANADPEGGEAIARKKVFFNAKGNPNLICKKKAAEIEGGVLPI